MSARSYNLDPKSATAADNTMSRIEDTGKYIGTLTRAESVLSRQQTEGVEFSFKADDGSTADFLTLWTHNAKGDELPSLKALNAMMTVCRVKSLTPTHGMVEKWDANSRQRTGVDATIFPELTNKRVGLLLQREEYEKNDGSVGSKLNIWGVFDADTELTASEILLRKTAPETLAKMLGALKDKPLKNRSHATQATQQAPAGMDDMDDDIPF